MAFSSSVVLSWCSFTNVPLRNGSFTIIVNDVCLRPCPLCVVSQNKRPSKYLISLTNIYPLLLHNWYHSSWGVYSGFIPFFLSPSFTSSSSVLSWQHIYMGFPGGSAGKESACNVGDLDLIPGLGRCPGEGKGYPLQYSCLKNPMDGGAWWGTVLGVAKSRTQLSDFTFTLNN